MFKFQLSSLFFSLLVLVGLESCSHQGEVVSYEVGFDYEIDTSKPNYVTFSNSSDGDYLYVQWEFGNEQSTGKITDQSSNRTIYYPLAGTYEVTLIVWGYLNNISDTKSITKIITIETDDPDYVETETLLWSDEFNNSVINTSYWTFETGDWGWGNEELQNYTDGDNARIENGVLIITAQKVNDDKTNGSYTSSRMITWGKQEFTYGRIEVRAKLPERIGVWPAIWMLGENIDTKGWPNCGEIDIMEYVGYEPNAIHSSLHTSSSYGSTINTAELNVENCEEEFNIYGMLWSEDSICFYVNDKDNPFYIYSPLVKTEDNWPFDKPHFFILNLAVGGTWGGVNGIDNSIFPQSMEVDYVRVYELY